MSDLMVVARESGELVTTAREPFFVHTRALPALEVPTAALEDQRIYTTVSPR